MTTHWTNFIPLIAFIWLSRLCGTQSATACPWTYAFYAGAVIAILQLLYTWYKKLPLDYIAIGTDVFLIFGAAAFLVFPPLVVPYAYFRQTVIFLWILVVGIITTVVRPEGFLQVNSHRYTTKSLTGSILLLGIVSLAFIASLVLIKYYDMGTAIGVALPFAAMLIGRETLRKQF